MSRSNKKRRLLTLLRTPSQINDISEQLRVSNKETKHIIRELRGDGFEIIAKNKHYFLQTAQDMPERLIDLPTGSKFAFFGDTHLGSKYTRMDALHQFYKEAEDEGVDFFAHMGDIIQGVGIYPTEARDLDYFTMEDQINFFIDNYPVSEIPTLFITGNHDLKQFEKGKSPNPARQVEAEREDLIHVGDYYGRLRGKGTQIKIDMLHPAGGNAYARSYQMQKYVEQIPVGEEPSVLGSGHTHDAIYLPYRGVHIIKTASFQGRNSFSLRKGLPTIIGGWIIGIEHDNKKINSLEAKFLEYHGG